MSETGLVQILEGALLAAGKPLSVALLAELFEEPERPENTAIREALKEIAERCEGRGFELAEVASGFRYQVRQALSPWVARLWHERPARYSRALLETLALIAYRQPITRGEIEEIRGVAVSSNIIKTLHEREWIRVVGHRDVPGRPAMYATTRQFLDYFNLKNLDQLPALAEIRDLDTLNAELGFSEPLSGQGEAGTPELTVVGGTEHVAGGDAPVATTPPVDTAAVDTAAVDAAAVDAAPVDTSASEAPASRDSETAELEPDSAGDLADAVDQLAARVARETDEASPVETDAGAKPENQA